MGTRPVGKKGRAAVSGYFADMTMQSVSDAWKSADEEEYQSGFGGGLVELVLWISDTNTADD